MEHEILTPEERFLKGKALREKCSRNKHSEWNPSLRTWDPITILENSNIDRIPGLVSIRYQRMSQSPFTFFRGSAIIHARDLANSPVSGITVQACGDCHLLNFGGFATPERSLAFDINDFDETFPGPWEWDIKRLAVSFVLAARDLGFSKNESEDAARQAVLSYRTKMSEFSKKSLLERWYEKITIENLIEAFGKNEGVLARLRKAEKRAASRTSEKLFPKLTNLQKEKPKIKDEPPLLYHLKNKELESRKNLEGYKKSLQQDRRLLLERYELVDSAIKVVGIGSVGSRCFVALFYANGSEPLFLQIKEARRSILENPEGKSIYEHQGFRVVNGQRLMQAASDIFLGWFQSESGHDYYVRQLHDMKIAPHIESFKASDLVDYASMCGWALARAHSKTGDAAMISGYLGSKDKFDEAVVKYALSYADQVESDFKLFKKAIQANTLKIKPKKEELLDFDI
ncbi:MAG TPA: DUF2252 domain-containing protein [Verrucomicrobiae bacterium]|nr:DUF2252 domain-containing protein [Verrucomicrobiae bacterium]